MSEQWQGIFKNLSSATDRMFIPPIPQIHMLKPDPQNDGIRGGACGGDYVNDGEAVINQCTCKGRPKKLPAPTPMWGDSKTGVCELESELSVDTKPVGAWSCTSSLQNCGK